MMNKQIEELREMADIMTEASHLACEDIPLMPTDTSVCYNIPCHRCKETRLLMYKGYRKQEDIAREIFAEIKKRFEALLNQLPSNGKYESVKIFIDAHWDFIANSILKKYGVTEDAL